MLYTCVAVVFASVRNNCLLRNLRLFLLAWWSGHQPRQSVSLVFRTPGSIVAYVDWQPSHQLSQPLAARHELVRVRCRTIDSSPGRLCQRVSLIGLTTTAEDPWRGLLETARRAQPVRDDHRWIAGKSSGGSGLRHFSSHMVSVFWSLVTLFGVGYDALAWLRARGRFLKTSLETVLRTISPRSILRRVSPGPRLGGVDPTGILPLYTNVGA